MLPFITKNSLEVGIRLAEIRDLESMQRLNQKWTVTSLESCNKENGFLFCETYKTNDLTKIIKANETAVAMHNDKIIGYYINDNDSALIERHSHAINELKSKGIIDRSFNVSKRTQIVVEAAFQKQGIPAAMLTFLQPMLFKRHHLLFSIGRNDNPKKIAHQKAGWKIVFENDEIYYCIYDLHQ